VRARACAALVTVFGGLGGDEKECTSIRARVQQQGQQLLTYPPPRFISTLATILTTAASGEFGDGAAAASFWAAAARVGGRARPCDGGVQWLGDLAVIVGRIMRVRAAASPM